MHEEIEYIEDLLQIIRSVTQPVSDRVERNTVSHNWDDVFNRLKKLKETSVEGSTSLDAITDSVKSILIEKFPGATLNRDELANNSNVVLFTQGKNKYNTITISAE